MPTMPININTDLLIAAPILQDTFVDKNGIPMAGGTITCYHDNSRTTLKNWYYQSGTPGNYSWIPLPNPLTLSAAGTICDINGVDTIPFFYPYSEINEAVLDPYYITIVNYFRTNQITRANFPFLGTANNNPNAVNTFNNLIVNGAFWRNIAPNTLNVTPASSTNLSSITQIVVAPSQHDGFAFPDIQFIKNNTSASDSVAFLPFSLSNAQPIVNYIVPEYYAQHVCSGAGTGETQKCYQFPISLHLNTLSNVPYTVFIEAQNGGSGAGIISLYLLQSTGTGTTSPAPIIIGQITLNSSWQQYTFTSEFPATSGLVLGNGADDAWYLQVQMPLNTACTINFTKPSLFLTEDIIPTNDFQTYDQIDTIINSPRTGDIRISLNTFYYFGWVPMSNGTIGNNLSNATARANADAWPLFNLLWTLFNLYTTGTSNPFSQMYTSSGTPTPVAYGVSAIADWNANNKLALTSLMGQVMLGTVPAGALLPPYKQVVISIGTSSGNILFTVTYISFIFVGQPLTLISSNGVFPGSLTAANIYYVTNISGSTFQLASSFANAIAGTATGGAATSSGVITLIFQLAGSSEGEYSHTQSLAELVNHNHTYTHTVTTILAPSTDASGPITTSNANTGSTGGGLPFNVTQPGTFYNMFIKL